MAETMAMPSGIPLPEDTTPLVLEGIPVEQVVSKTVTTNENSAESDIPTAESTTATAMTEKLKNPTISFDEDSITNTKKKIEMEERAKTPVEDSDETESSMNVNALNDNSPDDESQPHQIEPEGTTPVVRGNASRRFDDDMLEKIMAGSGEEQEIKAEDDSSMENTKSQNEIVPIENGDTSIEEDHGENVEHKLMEAPGSPAKLGRSASESASERERRLKDIENHHPNEAPPLHERRIEKSSEREEEKKGDDETTQEIEFSRTKTLLTALPKERGDEQIDYAEKPSTEADDNVQLKNTSGNKSEKTERQQVESTPTRAMKSGVQNHHNNIVNPRHSGQFPNYHHEMVSQTPNSLSPDFFLADHESVPIPHLPPLMVPGVGSGPSYDSMSVQGASHALHVNHTGYQHPPSILHQQSSFASIQQHQQQAGFSVPNQVTTLPGGKRKIHLHLWEDLSALSQPEKSSFLSFRRRKGILRKHPTDSTPNSELGDSNHSTGNNDSQWADRGRLTISWYEGTTSLELQEHVHNSVIRKLGLKSTTKLLDFRVLDESSNPSEEIVLSPYIPHGSRLSLRFAVSDGSGDLTPPKYTRFSDYDSGPPDSPSAAPSPYPTSLDLNGLGLNANQLALLGTRLNSLHVPVIDASDPNTRSKLKKKTGRKSSKQQQQQLEPQLEKMSPLESPEETDDEGDNTSKGSNFEVASLHPEDQIQKSLRAITTLLKESTGPRQHYVPRQEKRQVVFVVANYFVLVLSILAISAEIQARAPGWHAAMEQQLQNVQDCSKDKESLLQCVENGDMAGLVASVILWLSRSAATKRIFLLGFKSPHKLWTAVYESLVTATCWGFSYMFIRRGMNPDSNRDFLRRYWKDAIYGSLAGFNAAFMKQVMKNLIPQEVIEDALQERRLKILSWLPSH